MRAAVLFEASEKVPSPSQVPGKNQSHTQRPENKRECFERKPSKKQGRKRYQTRVGVGEKWSGDQNFVGKKFRQKFPETVV